MNTQKPAVRIAPPRITALLACLTAMFLADCSSGPAARADGQIRLEVERFLAAVNGADSNAFVDFFAADATAFFPTTPTRQSGQDEIRTAIAPAFAQGPRQIPARPGDLQISVHGKFAVASFDAGNGDLHARRTLIFERLGGQWKIVHLHASNVSESRSLSAD